MSSRGAQGSGSRGRGDRGGGRGRGDRGDFRGGRGGGRGGSSYDGPSDSRAGSEAGTSGGSWKGGFRGRGGGGDRGGSRGGRGGYGGGNTIFNPGELSQPDPVVTETENQVVSSPSLAGLSLSDSMPPRPGYITEGRKVILRANYFQLSAIKDLPLYEYSLTIYPTESNMPQRTKRQIYRLLLEHPDLKKVTACTDFEQTLITTPALDSARVKVPIVYRYEDETSPREDAKTYTVAIGDQTAINVENLRDYLEAKSRTPFEGKDRILKALNILVAKTPENMSDVVCYNQRYFPVGPTMQMTSLGGGIVAIRGFFSSVRTATARTLLNVNPCTGAFVRPGSLLDTMNEFLRSGGSVSQLRMPATRTKTIANIPQSPRDKRYGIAREVRFKLSKVDKNGNPTSSSPTIAQYFKEERGIELTRPDFLVVNVGSTDPKGHQEFWPPELCEVVPGHLTKVKLTPNQTTEMLGVAARKPAENAEFIVGEGARVTGLAAPQSNLASFGFRGNPNMITVEGHVLSPPKVKYSTKSRQPDVVPRNGQWNMAEKKFTNGATIPSWTSLNLCQTSVARDIDTFKQGMINCGMRVPDSVPPNGFRATIQEIPQGDEVPAAEKERIEKENKEAVRKALEQASKTARMVLVILPDNRASTYAIVKQLGDIEVGIHTVCSVYNKFTRTKGQDQYMANVALKVNLKFGGTNQAISTDKLGILSDGKTMLVGMDVTHPSAFSQEGTPSVAAVVANHDPLYSQWPGSVRCQTGRQEMIQDLEEMLIERLRLWRDKNRGLPSRVIVYRDGVSEGQFKLVLMNEKPAIDRALRKMYAGGKAPPLSIVVVGKRHHTRFYPTKAEDADERTGNPLNGTTVDRGVTHERLFDFYLQAHRGLQGTARPGHYTVIWDENKFTANTLQTLTHNLCYLFGRATLAVSICPPAYYADLICDRARNYLYKAYNESSQGNIKIKFDPLHAWSGGVHERLKDSMFYI